MLVTQKQVRQETFIEWPSHGRHNHPTMAFQQPQHRPQPSRQLSIPRATVDTPAPASPLRKRALDESHEWILFSPQNDAHTSTTPRTATQPSDFGSLETHIRSQPIERDSQDADLTCQGTEVDDDGAELDSLDDGLHAFHHPFSPSSNLHLDQSGGTVLPTHDGFGTFPSTAGLQERLWQFERHNPHRRKHVRRRSSVQKKLDAMEEDLELNQEDEKTARIEKWRLEQSRAVLEEIEKETRRRRRRLSRMSGAADTRPALHESAITAAVQRQDSMIPEESEAAKSEAPQQSESFWQRITRKVIQDLIGIDENTLSVIFGESLPEDPSPTPTAPSPIAMAASSESRVTFNDPSYSWEVKLLDRIARELGGLVHQLYEHDGRAFTTYLQTGEVPEYAGIPMRERETPARQPSLRQRVRQQAQRTGSTDLQFEPTLSQQTPISPSDAPDSSLWGIEEEPAQNADQDAQARHDREYWEREIDVHMIFDYLKRRFSRSSTASQPQPQTSSAVPTDSGPLPTSWMTTGGTNIASTSPTSLRRAEVIRQQHPLVSRAAAAAQQNRRRDSSLLRRHQMQSLLAKRAAEGESSCASQSTKRSRRSRSGSSRHYWLDGSASVGSGHGMGSGLGGWGEV